MNAPMRQTSTLAIISLVAGILGWTLAPLLGSIGAVVCGHLARAEIRREPDRLEGDGFAIAGLVLGWGQIILGILFLVVVVMFFGGLAAILAWIAANSPGTIST
jgi:hypothetical protein